MTKTLATASDLAAIPNDGYRYYLIRGEIRRRAIASYAYGIVAARLAFPLINLAEKGQAGIATVGDTGYRLGRNPDTVLTPVAAFIANEYLPPPDERDYTTHICEPTVAVEVVSPSITRREVVEKVEAYLEAGVRLIWVAFPETKSVLVDGAGREPVILTEHDLLDGSDVLPTLRPLRIAGIFR